MELLLLGCYVMFSPRSTGAASLESAAGVGEVDLSYTFLSKKLVTNMHSETNCSCLDKCYSCCSFVYLVKVECFGWLIASPKPPPLGVLELFLCNDL